jgi:PAS domain S-box-containing protein
MGNEPVVDNGTEKDARFSRVFRFLPDAALVARAEDSVILEINQAFEALTGYGPDAFVGRSALSLGFFMDPDTWGRMRRELNVTGAVLGLDMRLRRADGQVAFVRMNVSGVELDGASCLLATIHETPVRAVTEMAARAPRNEGGDGAENLLPPDADTDREDIRRLIDVQAFQELMNLFYKMTGVGVGMTDVSGNVLVSTGWQDICLRFHRVHPQTLEKCRESDVYCAGAVKEGENALYKCKNGMWDLATPVIVGARHVANLFIGQFFFDDESPDLDFFRNQAERYGFNVGEYMAALERAPRLSRETVDNVMDFYAKMVSLVLRLNIGLSRTILEQKKVEEELLLNKFCIDNAGIGIFQTEEKRILGANKHACRSLGCTEDELRSMSVFDIDPIITTKRILEIKEVLDTCGSITHQTMHRRRDGTTFPVEITTNTVPFRGRQVGVSFVKDITEQKHAEEALRAKTEELDRYFTHALDLFCIADTDGFFRRLNKEWENMLGYSLTDLEGARFLDYVHPDDLDATLATVARLGEQEEVLNFVNRYRAKDGSYRWVEWRSFPAGTLIYAAARDITERKLAEEALRESEEKFRVLSETSPAAIALYQGEDVIYINPTAARLIGYSVEELSRISFWGCVHEDFREMVRERGIARMKGEAVPSQYECKFVTKDGRELWAIISVGLIEFKGRPAGIVTLIDRTEAKAAEERIRASLAEKEVLLKEVHHRVKNNLQIISTLLMLQSESVRDEKLLRSFRDSQDRIAAMALIHERLYKSPDFASIDFAEYIGNLAGSLFDSYLVDPGSIVLHVDTGGMVMDIDRAIPCGLIVNELLSNSLKYAFPDNRAGEISVRFRSCEDGRITLTVVDTGVGLPSGFDFRNTETLGLQLVCMLVTQLRGQIDIDSGQDGTVVSISFPSSSSP